MSTGLFDSSSLPTYTDQYTAQTGLTDYVNQNKLSNPQTLSNTSISQYYDPSQLQTDIYNGIKANTDETYKDSLNSLNYTMGNTGLYRSGLTLANQNKLEGEKMDALAKGYGDTAYNVANLQNQYATSQAQLDYDTAKYNADIQNSWNEQNNTNAFTAAQADQTAANDAAKFNITTQTSYDQIAYDYMKSMLQAELQNQSYLSDYINSMTNAVMQTSDTASKSQWLKDLPGLLSDATAGLSSNYGL